MKLQSLPSTLMKCQSKMNNCKQNQSLILGGAQIFYIKKDNF